MKAQIQTKNEKAVAILNAQGWVKNGEWYEKEASSARCFIPVEDACIQAGIRGFNPEMPYNNPADVVGRATIK
jgi:hypothetical protein